MRMPRVGVTCYASQGGSGVVATELGLNLARRGCEVHFISSELPFRLKHYDQNIFYHKVEMPLYPVFQHSPYTLSLATVMSEVATRYDLDLLHVHYAIPHTASAYLAREMVKPRRLPVVTTLHGTDITLVGQEPSFFPITRFLIEQSDAVTAVSGFLKEETIRVFGIGESIQVIPNFVDARVFKPLTDLGRRERFAGEDELVVMHASNFRKVKNVTAVVEVFARVVREHPARLLLVGDGPELVTVRDLVASLGLTDRVRFMGQFDRLEEILPVAHVLLLPSLHESFGLVALEAMACGVVPVATDRGGAGEFIQDGINGFLRSPDDIQGMAAVILDLARDPDLTQQIAEDARRDAAGEFGVGCVVKTYLELYESLLSGG
ncbi:MAG: N-acetyl-alpha-D-glucosaminyl L-malate synthase BshA [bacterium]